MKIHVNEAKKAFQINRSFEGSITATPDGLTAEVFVLDGSNLRLGSGSVNVKMPCSAFTLSENLRYAATKALYSYIGGELVAPAKDGGKSVESVANRLSEAARMLTYDRHFYSAAANILEKV